MKYKLRVSSSIVNFREKAEKTWKLKRYRFPWDIFKPTVFFGCYHIADYAYYIFHRGEKTIIWAGSDIQTLVRSKIPWYLLFREITNYVENNVEWDGLASKRIYAKVRPSFLEDVNDFPVSFKPMDKPQVFLTAHLSREKEYGLYIIEKIAERLPNIIFHIYGSGIYYPTKFSNNMIFHGFIPPEQFNREIKNYHCGLRLNEHDGFSEILAKSVLMGQYPISRIKYPHIDYYETEEELIVLLKALKDKIQPNLEARQFWKKNVNNYPWVKNE